MKQKVMPSMCVQRNIARGKVHSGHGDYVAYDSDSEGNRDVIESLSLFVGMSRMQSGSAISRRKKERNAYLATKKAPIAATNQGGATSISVTVVLKLSVAVNVGKNALNDSAITSDDSATASHHALGSAIASQNACLCFVGPSASIVGIDECTSASS